MTRTLCLNCQKQLAARKDVSRPNPRRIYCDRAVCVKQRNRRRQAKHRRVTNPTPEQRPPWLDDVLAELRVESQPDADDQVTVDRATIAATALLLEELGSRLDAEMTAVLKKSKSPRQEALVQEISATIGDTDLVKERLSKARA